MMPVGQVFKVTARRHGGNICSLVWLASVISVLVGCASVSSTLGLSTSEKNKPAELAINVPKLAVRLAWSGKVNAVNFPLDIAVAGVSNINTASITIAASDGVVASFDAATGRELWRAQTGKALAAGVGAEGATAAVVTDTNELITFENGREVWRQKLSTSSFTAPLVSNGKVYVLGSDRSVSAFEGNNTAKLGSKLWTQKRSTEALILRQAGVLLMVNDTLVASSSGRLIGMNPLDGSIRWETPIATARGTNDIERLVDLVGRVSNVSEVVCARAYRVSVGCVNTFRGKLVWSKQAVGFEGVQADDRSLYGAESDGKVIAWNSANGERLWIAEQLLGRSLSAPAVMDKAIVVGDSTGLLHFLSKTDGSSLNRLPTDGSAMAAAPVVVGNTLVVVTRNGGVFGFTAD
jgi:outer membrane assembly lipoprotein YfgL